MIFNIGESPSMDVLRMLMHYAVVQQKQIEQTKIQVKKNVPVINTLPIKTSSVAMPKVADITSSDASLSNDGPRRLHVTNLPFKVKDHELRAMFEVHGVVLDAEIIYNERGSKGFGFVTMETAEAATQAKDALNKKDIDGRKIEVNNATPRAVQNKAPIRLKTRITPTPQNSQVSDILRTTQTANFQAFPGAWNPTQFTCLTTSPVQTTAINFPFPPLPVQPVNLAPISNSTTAFSGLTCFPTPEQYTQYYNYLTAQTRGNHQNGGGSFGSHRYQPY